MSTERIILHELIYNEKYLRKVIPYIKAEYFGNKDEAHLFKMVEQYFQTYNVPPVPNALYIDLSNDTSLNEKIFKDVKSLIDTIDEVKQDYNFDWLVDTTEEFCKDRAIHNALLESISIIDDEKSKKSKGEIPDLLSKALAISFDPDIGHDYLEDWEKRYEEYHTKEKRVPFDLAVFNDMTEGGLPTKTLTIILAGTHAGKTRMMCSMAANNLREQKNVLYITLEMGAIRGISERIDANLLDVPIGDLKRLSKLEFQKKIEKLSKTTKGKLIVKEYPTATAGTIQFQHLLSELKLKQNFVPDIIYVDYLNICISSRMNMGSSGSYLYFKAVAEELRGLAGIYDVPVVTATQVNRSGFNSSDIDMTDTSESFGLPQTADVMFALMVTEDLNEIDQVMVKQLKNRLSDMTKMPRFVVGIDKPKMRHYDVESDAQIGFKDSPVMDNTITAEKTGRFKDFEFSEEEYSKFGDFI